MQVLELLGGAAVHVLWFALSLALAFAVLGVLLVAGAFLFDGSRREGMDRRSVVVVPVSGLLRRRDSAPGERTGRFQMLCFVLVLTVLVNWMLHGALPSVVLGLVALGVAWLTR